MSTRPPAVPALTGIRFVAALHVVLFHYASDVLSTAHWSIRAILASGASAVSLFYVLSGAVLVYSCTNVEGALGTTKPQFWRARFARIYPTYFLALALDLPFFISSVLKGHEGAVMPWALGLGLPGVLLLQAWIPLAVFAWNTPGWSVSAEAFFYALFPTLTRRLRSRSVFQIVGRLSFFYCLALIPPVIVVTMNLFAGGLDLHTWIVRLAGFSPIARLPEFLMGMCLGHWLKRDRPLLSTAFAATFEFVAIALLVAAFIALGSHAGSKPWLDSGVLSPLFVLLIAALALGHGPVARLLSTAPLQIFGSASYALYILQEPVLIWCLKVPVIGTLPIRVFVPLFVVTLIAASVGCQRFLAEPARVWLVRSKSSRVRTEARVER